MTSTSAYLLVFHGSRDSGSLLAASQLAGLILKQLELKIILAQRSNLSPQLSSKAARIVTINSSDFTPLVDIAALELASLPLHQNIVRFAKIACQQGYKQIKLLPLFLGAGVHVREDIPLEIDKAKQIIAEAIPIELSTYLGNYSAMSRLLANKFRQLSGEERILLAHGSRSKNSNSSIQSLATQLQAEAAYWSVTPHLSDRIWSSVARGKLKIAILPYFLFAGKIFEAISTEVERLRTLFPQATLILGEPLGATSELAALIVEEMTQ
ncbi:sirohydrochlorin chelatase [Myxosarcina sp. GI1]|uniref:sirohydrochlorin chelatase n=1 Tax=Myxosarcina sp. GI1 TaxID=1541065 RepID=UPI000567F31E|nr:sirohydrochlorin chelatase [Myxosarcina sp. GI1]